MSFVNAFVKAVPKARLIGNKVVLKNQSNFDTIALDNVSPDVLALYVDRYGDSALNTIFEHEKRRMIDWMYGGNYGSKGR